MRFIFWLCRFWLLGTIFAVCMVIAIISAFSLYLGPQLPRIDSVLDLKLQTPLKVLSADGLIIGEFGETRRQPLTFKELPPLFVQAILAAEDDRFFTHGGVDASGLLRAASELVKSGKIQSGGSTITMQLARNFFLSTEKSFIRKLNEILLSIQLERTLSKEQIFELYANKIFLGHRAYGVESAAFVYYGKGLKELSLAQWAMLAGLPKAPSKYNPIVNPTRALIRRNWILDRMLKLGFIDQNTHHAAISEAETASFHGLKTDIDAPFVAEMARQFAVEKLGNEAYTGGYSVRTTIDSRLQLIAQEAIWQGVSDYDRRHGYRGPESHFPAVNTPEARIIWLTILNNTNKVGDLQPAIVTQINKSSLQILLQNNTLIEIAWTPEIAKTLRPYKSENYVGPSPEGFSVIFKIGDLIRVRPIGIERWEINQIPKIQAALASLNSETGEIISLVGGSDFTYSKFNRATQALRQPGSSFKPFYYLEALEEGYTPATLINDAPIVFQEAGMKEAWHPENAHDDYLGPTRLRRALYESRNMVSIRIVQNLGVKNVIKHLPRFGFDISNMQPNLSIALGSHAFSPLTMAGAYAVLANGGYTVQPHVVQRIEDTKGNIIFQQAVESPQDPSQRVVDEQAAYILDDILRDVIRKGTGRAALVLNRPDIAGKTGTTNGPTDAWFAGYNPAVTTTVWMGFDDNTLLGKKEYGGTAALPVWISFMKEALKDQPVIERAMPAGLTTVRIDPSTGQPASTDRSDAIFEIFHSTSNASDEGIDNTDNESGTDLHPESNSTEDLF